MLGDTISVQGAVDTHIHTHPCLFPRLTDDRGAVEAAVNAGMAGVMLKCHFESTASRAYHMGELFPDIKVFGGIVLNTYVGGFNPAAVEVCLKLGGKQVWMPTIDAANHAAVFGSTGRYDVQAVDSSRPAHPGISPLKDGKVLPEVYEILDLVAEHNVMLGTSHLSAQEILAVVRAAKERKVQKVVITHPFFKVPQLEVSVLKELVSMGAIAEFAYCDVSPMIMSTTVEKVKQAIQEVGPNRCIIMSDNGQRHNPMPCEGLRIFAQCLYEKGLSQAEVEKLIIHNPKQLLDMD